MNILPQSTLRIVRQLAYPDDVGTNYVRAVVRNSATSEVLTTINLTDGGNQRFTGSYYTQPDALGEGYYLDITTTVYTDSGYTSKNQNYSIETNTYHVYREQNLGGGFGGPDVDYKKIKKIIAEEVEKIPQPDQTEVRNIYDKVRAMQTYLTNLRIPEPKDVDFSGAISAISDKVSRAKTELLASVDDAVNTTLIAIDQKEVTPTPDLTPLAEKMDTLPIADILASLRAMEEKIGEIETKIGIQKEEMARVNEAASNFISAVSPKQFTVPKGTGEDPFLARSRKLLGV